MPKSRSPRARAESRSTLDLLEKGDHITKSSRKMIEQFMATWGMSAYHAVLETHIMSEAEMANALAAALKLTRIDSLRDRQIDPVAATRLGFRRARLWECVPFICSNKGLSFIEVVLADPSYEDRVAVLKRELGEQITLSVAERSDIVLAIDEHYPLAVQLPTLFSQLESDP